MCAHGARIFSSGEFVQLFRACLPSGDKRGKCTASLSRKVVAVSSLDLVYQAVFSKQAQQATDLRGLTALVNRRPSSGMQQEANIPVSKSADSKLAMEHSLGQVSIETR